MIRTLLYNPKTDNTVYGGEELFSEWKQNTDLWIWADFDNEAPEHEKALFKDTFGLHSLAVSDAQNSRHQ